VANAKHPAEVFGYPIDVDSKEAQDHRKRHWCPFADDKCDKKTRLVDYPMGVCSVQYGEDVIALSPRRFLQDMTVFYDIADHHFKTRSDLICFDEVAIPSAQNLGRFDYVIVKHKPLSSEIEDFVAVEFQTGQTTNTGPLVQALNHFMQGQDVTVGSYEFGINWADIWKRTFTQILTKGIVLERWGHKIYWVVQEQVYQDFLNRYKLHGMEYDPSHSTVFAIYDLKRSGDKYELQQTRIESSAIDDLFEAFRTNLDVPPKEVFMRALQARAEKKSRAKMRLELRPE